jgi:Putative zinc ribbon domain
MSASQPKGPFCQSCSMPLAQPEDFGTNAAGFRVNDYCRHCFGNGVFTEPLISMTAMIDRCVAVMSQRGIMAEPQARALLNDVMPRLKRWRVTEHASTAATPF